MPRLIINELLAHSTEQNNLNATKMAEILSTYSSTQLNWQASTQSWSIHQVVQHLNATHQHYLSAFEHVLDVATKQAPSKKYRTGRIGNKFFKMMSFSNDKVVHKLRTFKKVNPHKISLPADNIAHSYQQHISNFNQLIEQSKQYRIQKLKITSLGGNIIRFKAADVIRFLPLHDQRHLVQINTIIDHSNFPST